MNFGEWTIYKTATGRIDRVFLGDEITAAWNVHEGESLIEGRVDPKITLTHYVVDGAIVARPALPAWNKTSITADGVDTATMNVGVPAKVSVNGVDYDVPGGVIEIISNVPATYQVVVEAFPFISATFEIEAT